MSILKQNCPVALCSDHAGYDTKEAVKAYLESEGIAYKDFGTYSTDSCDYPDFAHPCAEAVEKGECYPGIAVCGSGEGISMTLNKHQGIRAGLCWDPEVASLIRRHNDANALCMGGRVVGPGLACQLVDLFLNTPFEGGRHEKRIAKLMAIETR
mgnify:CR=1 FL=1